MSSEFQVDGVPVAEVRGGLTEHRSLEGPCFVMGHHSTERFEPGLVRCEACGLVIEFYEQDGELRWRDASEEQLRARAQQEGEQDSAPEMPAPGPTAPPPNAQARAATILQTMMDEQEEKTRVADRRGEAISHIQAWARWSVLLDAKVRIAAALEEESP